MKIKRYIGNTTKEAMDKLKEELGSEAVILHTRRIKKRGMLGIFKKQLVEIVAAEDDIKEKSQNNYKINMSNNKVNMNNRDKTNMNNSSKININNNNKINMNNNNKINMSNNKEIIKSDLFTKNNENYNNINAEIRRMRETMEKLMDNISNSEGVKYHLSEALKEIHENLIHNGVDDSIALNILRNIDFRIDVSNKDKGTIAEAVSYDIMEYLGKPRPIQLNGNQKIIFFVGPTGVGKTTTLAKIAAQYALNNKHNIGLITSDTYRIAAVEQLKTYSEILNIPLKIIYETKEIYSALSNFKNKEIILVDTAGRNHRNKEKINEIEELISTTKNKEIYLVLSATTDFKLLKEILKEYDFINDYKIIFTKIDEADKLGIILNTKYYTNCSLSYLTTGQNVPEDIEIADINKLTKKIVGEL